VHLQKIIGEPFVRDRHGSAASSENIQTVFLRLNSFAATGDLVLRNWMTSSREGVLKAVRIAPENGSKPAACDSDPAGTKALAQALSLPFATMTPGSEGALSASILRLIPRVDYDRSQFRDINRLVADLICAQAGISQIIVAFPKR
jgi:hypothetical protein